MKEDVGREALDLVAHYVGLKIDMAIVRGEINKALATRGWFKKSRVVRKGLQSALSQLIEAPSPETAERVKELEKALKALKAERGEIVAPYKSTLSDLSFKKALVEKVEFPKVLEKAQMEPIRHL